MTLAAMLLMSIGAFAQSGTTLKGDVNSDGKIDVEDVTSVVDLILSGKTYGYFYFGTTQPTANNYQTLTEVVASYTSIGDAIGTTAAIDEGQTLYMLCPATWMKGKKLILEDVAGSTFNFIEDVDAETVSGYVIYKTQPWNEATDLTLNFEITGGDEKYWYVGLTQPTEDNYMSIATEVTAYNDHYEFTNTSSEKAYIYVLVSADISVQMQPGEPEGSVTIEEVTSVNISGHKVYKTAVRMAAGGTIWVDLGDEWKHYYLGTTEPTEDNIETLTPSYKSFAEMNNITIHVPAEGKLYLLAPYSYSEPESFNKIRRNAFIDSEGNNVTFSYWTGYYKFRHIYVKLIVENETTVTFKYPFE